MKLKKARPGYFKRFLCAFLSCVLFLLSPAHAYASATAAAVTTVCYAVYYILAACGVVISANMLGTLIGDWADEAEYLLRGAEKTLGVYAQRVYEYARSQDSAIAEKYKEIEKILLSCASAAWGETVTGIRPLAADISEFLKEAFGYGAKGAWYLPAVPEEHTWGVSQWSAREAYPVPVGPLYPSYPTDPDYTYFLTSYVQSAYGSDCMNIQNWYYLNSLDIFGVYDVPSMTLTTYKRNAAASEYSVYRAAAYSVFVNSDGSLRFSPGISSGWYRDTMLCSPADAGSLPFPVFASMEDAKNYVATGEAVNTYVSGTVPMEVEVFREDAASLVENALSGILSFPASADLAASNMAALADTYPAGTLEDVRETVGAGGLELGDTTDIPVTGDAALSDILEAVRDLPAAIAGSVADAFSFEASEAEEQLSVPGIISEKFPFCIPFDVIYLVETLAADRETPRFVIPINIDYQFVHYHQEFVLDFSEWEPAVVIFRIMLDLLFCACLIAATRSLIRG